MKIKEFLKKNKDELIRIGYYTLGSVIGLYVGYRYGQYKAGVRIGEILNPEECEDLINRLIKQKYGI